jgi:hypothetical protein
MPDENVGAKIQRASIAIGDCIGTTVLAMQDELKKNFDLDGSQLAIAVVVAQLNLLAAAVAGVVLGGNVTDENLHAKMTEIIDKIKPVIDSVLNVPE